MPRPTRIEYENASYHVMNRGRGSQRIFHAQTYYQAFLTTLADAHERFGCANPHLLLNGQSLPSPPANPARQSRARHAAYQWGVRATVIA